MCLTAKLAVSQAGNTFGLRRAFSPSHIQGTPGTPQNEDRTETDPTRTDAKTQSNSIYLAQVPQNSRFWNFFSSRKQEKSTFGSTASLLSAPCWRSAVSQNSDLEVFSSTEKEKQRIAPKAFFRGCGRNSTSSQSIQNLLVRSYHSPEKHTIAPKARFWGCGRSSKSSQ